MANKLLGAWGGELVGKCWVERFITYLDKLKIAFNQAKNHQRIQQKDPEVISAWFKLIKETKDKYSVQNNNMHNFNKTGF